MNSPVIGFAGFSGSGKTVLAAKVVRILQAKGRKIAVIKHDAHGHYKEAEGTDSSKYIEAGADAVIVASPNRSILFERRASDGLSEILQSLHDYDLIIVEGYKQEKHPKIAVFYNARQATILKSADHVVAIAAGIPFRHGNIPVLSIDDAHEVAAWIESNIII